MVPQGILAISRSLNGKVTIRRLPRAASPPDAGDLSRHAGRRTEQPLHPLIYGNRSSQSMMFRQALADWKKINTRSGCSWLPSSAERLDSDLLYAVSTVKSCRRWRKC